MPSYAISYVKDIYNAPLKLDVVHVPKVPFLNTSAFADADETLTTPDVADAVPLSYTDKATPAHTCPATVAATKGKSNP